MRLTIFIIFVLLYELSFSQKGKVDIINDSRINALVAKEGLIIPPATSPQINGYRIQLYFDSDKNKVDEARAKFINLYPKIDTYVNYTAPNYFLKVGDFRTFNEAEKIKSTTENIYPTGFIIKEKINLPRIDQ